MDNSQEKNLQVDFTQIILGAIWTIGQVVIALIENGYFWHIVYILLLYLVFRMSKKTIVNDYVYISQYSDEKLLFSKSDC